MGRIIGDRLVGPIKVPEGVKVTSAAYCNLLSEFLVPWLDDIPLSLLRAFVFMHDNTPSDSARATQAFLATLRVQDEKFIIGPPSYPDLNPIEKNLGLSSNETFMAMDSNFHRKKSCGKPINAAARAVPRATIKELTDSMNTRLFDVIKGHGSHVGK